MPVNPRVAEIRRRIDAVRSATERAEPAECIAPPPGQLMLLGGPLDPDGLLTPSERAQPFTADRTISHVFLAILDDLCTELETMQLAINHAAAEARHANENIALIAKGVTPDV